MGKKKEIVAEQKNSGKSMEDIMEELSDHKVTFAKVSWGAGKGPYILAFEDSCVKEYCEMNSHEFKTISLKDIKQESVPLWECGSKTPEQINKLKKLNIKEFSERASKEKQAKKEAKVAKFKAALKQKKS